MNVEEFYEYCLALPYVQASFPFDEDNLCFFIADKMFALCSLSRATVNLKCNPEKAIELRIAHDSIFPAWHMNKKHWNSILLNSDISDELWAEMIRDSYRLVYQKLTKAQQKSMPL